MATLSNEARNNSTLSNEELGSKTRKWQGQNYTWDEAQGIWVNPFNMSNEASNDATLSNEATS